MSRDQRIDQSATSYWVCKFKTTVRGATYLMTSHVSSALWTLTSVIGRGRSADWAIQGPSEAGKKLLYINICNTKFGKDQYLYFSTILEI